MSNITDIVFSAQNGQLIDGLAERFGLSKEQIEAAVNALIPAVSAGLTNAAEQANSLETIIGAAAQPQHLAAYDAGDYSDDSIEHGRELVANLFGSNAEANQVVQVAARAAGLRPDIMSQLLPVLISVVLGGLFKGSGQGLGGVLGQLASSGALGSILGQLTGGGLGGGAPPPPPQQQPPPAPRSGGGLGGLLGGLLGSLLGGGRRPAPGGGGLERGGPSPGGFESAPQAGPGGLPDGLDAESLQAALEQIKKTLQPGGAGANAGHQADLQDVLGQIFGQRGR